MDSKNVDQVVADGLSAYAKMANDRDQYKAMAEQWERAHAIAIAEVELLKGSLARTESQLGFHMRHGTELQTHLADARDLAIHTTALIDNVLLKARQGAYRPSGQGRMEARPQQGGNDPIPKFLTEQRYPLQPDQLAELERLIREQPTPVQQKDSVDG